MLAGGGCGHRRERPHPGAQLRFDDVEGLPADRVCHQHEAGTPSIWRSGTAAGPGVRTGFVMPRTLAWSTLARFRPEPHLVPDCRDRRRPMAWMGLLAHPQAEARRWEPKKLRHRLFTIPATIARTGRRTILHVSNRHRWAGLVVAAITTLRGLPVPAWLARRPCL